MNLQQQTNKIKEVILNNKVVILVLVLRNTSEENKVL